MMKRFEHLILGAATALFLGLLASGSTATTLLNGDFSSYGPDPYLPDDYVTQSCIGVCVPGEGSGRVSVEGRGGDPYLQLTSAPTPVVDLTVLVSQTVSIMAGSSTFSFDLGINDPFVGLGGGSNLLLSFDDTATAFADGWDIIGFNRNDYLLQCVGDPGTIFPGCGFIPATVTALAPGGLFDWNVSIDMSFLAGKEIDLVFRLFEPAGDYTTVYNLDNLSFNTGVGVVPLPAPLFLLVSGLFSIGLFRRKSV